MQSRKGHNSNIPNEQIKIQSLRKVGPNDRFPCFSCFDDPKQKLSCPECHGNGWIMGSHPMVQFAQDFIEKKLGGLTASELGNTSDLQSDFGQINAHMTESEDPQKRLREVFPSSSVKTVALGDEIRHSRKRDQPEQFFQQNYHCDECITKEPIKGKRYHCKECTDYDLCENCYLARVHGEHEFEERLPVKRMDNESLMAQNKKINSLKKSIKMSK